MARKEYGFHTEDAKRALAWYGIQAKLVGTFLAEVMGWKRPELEGSGRENGALCFSPG